MVRYLSLDQREAEMEKTCELVDRMRCRREELGWSIRDLGRHLGVSFGSLARIERGEGFPCEATRVRLSAWLSDGRGFEPKVQTRRETWTVQVENRLRELEAEVIALREQLDALAQVAVG